jgi:hypothetical protein
MPAWFGVREYGGIWRRGGGKGQFGDTEVMGFLGDNRTTVLGEALSVYGIDGTTGSVLRPAWYRGQFVE